MTLSSGASYSVYSTNARAIISKNKELRKEQKETLEAARAEQGKAKKRLKEAEKSLENKLSLQKLDTRLDALKKELASTKKVAEKAQEEQRKASRQNLTLGEESLEEYRKLKDLQRVRDSLMSDLREFSKQKPRGKAEENLIVEVTRLKTVITLAKDDLTACK
ncbi:hypothetical protein JOM56_001109 [Amanita muscaria]